MYHAAVHPNEIHSKIVSSVRLRSWPRWVRTAWVRCFARDTKLGRDVALKVLREAFASQAMKPFQRSPAPHRHVSLWTQDIRDDRDLGGA